MNYRLRTTEEGRRGRREFWKIAGLVALVLIFAFVAPVRNFLSPAAIKITEPLFKAAAYLKDKTVFAFGFIAPQAALVKENAALKDSLQKEELRILDYERLKAENEELLKLSDIHKGDDFVIGRVLRVPDSSPFDTALIDVGANQNIASGDTVFALGETPIGQIDYVYGDTSRVKFFSTPGEEHVVRIGKDKISAAAMGRGGGNFETILPRGTLIAVGDLVFLPEVSSKVFATVEDVAETEGGTFIRILFKNPVSFSGLDFVSIEKKPL